MARIVVKKRVRKNQKNSKGEAKRVVLNGKRINTNTTKKAVVRRKRKQ